jgi:hypothetical protein
MGTTVAVSNNATGSLDAGITAGATSLDVKAGEGALFPSTAASAYFYVTLQKDSGAWEIVKVTTKATDTFTIVRNQDSSTGSAIAFSADDIVTCRPCAEVHDDVVAALNSHDSDHDGRFFTETEMTADNSLGIDAGNINNRSDIVHSDLTDDEATKHRLINDAGTAATELFSAQKIIAMMGGATNDFMVGLARRPQFTYSDADTITISGFRYHHNGTVEQCVKNDTDLTFDFGSGGSNAASTDLSGSGWQYLYFDDSAIVSNGTNVITAAEIMNSGDVPAWDADQLGWYGQGAINASTEDRCFGALYISSGDILDFRHWDNLISWGTAYSISSSTAAYTARTFRAPTFCRQADAKIVWINGNSYPRYRPADFGSGGSYIGYERRDTGGDNQDAGNGSTYVNVHLSASQQAQFYGVGTMTIYQWGYYLPESV